MLRSAVAAAKRPAAKMALSKACNGILDTLMAEVRFSTSFFQAAVSACRLTRPRIILAENIAVARAIRSANAE